MGRDEDQATLGSTKSRPVGSKIPVELARQLSALNKSAEDIDKMAGASCQQCKVAEEMLEIDLKGL